ncbi:MAG TPA: CHAD domain-containing protein [Candidatus Limnocylindrales bacterium]|nr:CHAD domain-containing protein [Candidatus Limnocylindrales bacterium]
MGLSEAAVDSETPPPGSAPDDADGQGADPAHATDQRAAPDGRQAAEPDQLRLGASPGAIIADDSFGEAGRKAMWPHVERLLRFERFLADPTKTDELKRYRVATRRLRAALRLFESAYPQRQARWLRDSLGDVGRAAGAVRDLDVRLADLEGWAKERGEEASADVAPLRGVWQAERARAATELLARLEARRYQRLRRELVDLVDGRVRLRPAGTRALRDSAASRLWRSFETLREEGTMVRGADLPALHAVRIGAKRLRYALEFFGDVLLPSRTVLIEKLVALQDHLGAINDAAVISAAVRAVLLDRRVAMTAGERATIARYAADRERDLVRLRRGVAGPWRPIASVTFARLLGRTVVIG